MPSFAGQTAQDGVELIEHPGDETGGPTELTLPMLSLSIAFQMKGETTQALIGETGLQGCGPTWADALSASAHKSMQRIANISQPVWQTWIRASLGLLAAQRRSWCSIEPDSGAAML